MDLTTLPFFDKSFSSWSEQEINYVLAQIEFEAERLLLKNSYYKAFMSAKRQVIQPLVNKIYDEIFESFGKKVTVHISKEEYDIIYNWVSEDYIPYKMDSDYGYKKGDTFNSVDRLVNGTCGNLAVVKYLGGGVSDLDFDIGPSGKFNVPDLKKFLGVDLGVKTARTGEAANLPLVLNYSNFTTEYKNSKWHRKKRVEAQYFVGQNDSNPLKYYMIGIANPRDIINHTHRAFTLDPKAMEKRKAGGGKGGFYGMHKTKHFEDRRALIKELNKEEYKSIPYPKI